LKIGFGVVLGVTLCVGSSVAVDRSAPRDRQRFSPKGNYEQKANPDQASNSPRSGNSTSRGLAAPARDPWEGIEQLIRKPVERPAKLFVDPQPSARIPAAANNESAVGEKAADGLARRPKVSDAPTSTLDSSEQSDSAADNLPIDDGSPALSPELNALRGKVRNVLSHYQKRNLNTRDHNPWEVMHAFVAFNVETMIHRDGPDGPPVNAIGWMLWGGRCRGQQMLTLSRGRPHAAEGVGVQGHPAQLLAILAQSRVSAKTPMRIDGKEFTLDDLIQEEMLDCRAGSELTFKLISFAHYRPSDTTWRSRDGQAWSIPRLINAEIKAPVRGAACGGTHRLFGISYAFKTREKEGRPLDGEFLRAKQYITSYQRYAFSLQNPDGSFSTEWFSRRDNRPDIERKIQTTGHITEWLVFSLADEQLREPALVKSVDFLATSLAREPNRAWSIGPLGHALHALLMYDERVFQADAGSQPSLADASVSGPIDGHDEESDPESDTESEPAAHDSTASEIRGPLLNLR
jgi:hypothetical protein